MNDEKLKELLATIDNEIEANEWMVNEATDEELKETAGYIEFGLNMRDYSKGCLETLKIIRKLIKQ